MLYLKVLVPESRDRSAVLILSDGMNRIREDVGAASSVPKLAAAHGNAACDPLRPWGHTPFGTYRLLKRASSPAGCDIEYGSELLLFEAQRGSALEAESFGRLAFLLYAGPAGQDKRLRRTQGGVRVSKTMMNEITTQLGAGGDMSMHIEALAAPAAWWQFWKPKYAVQPGPLSSDAPHLVSAPLDEASLIAELLKGTRSRRSQLATPNRDDDRDRWLRDSGSSDSQSYRGGGGEFAGGGASGSWGQAGAARPAGVDAAGRIIGATAAAGIAADAFAAASRESDAGGGAPTASESAGGTGTNTDTSY